MKNLRRFAGSGCPAAYALMGLAAAGMLVWFSLSGSPERLAAFVRAVGLNTAEALERPWTLLTYPLLGVDPMGTLFILLSLYFFAIPIERAWGTVRFVGFVLASTVLTGVSAAVGSALFGHPKIIGSMVLTTSYCVVAWAVRNPKARVLLYFAIPLEARWIGWAVAVIVVIAYSYAAPIQAPFYALPFVGVWAYASGRLRLRDRPRRTAREGDYGGISWEKRRQAEAERRRLKELFERSWGSDDDEPGSASN
jgi:membrane associated rhomboid family serine protease